MKWLILLCQELVFSIREWILLRNWEGVSRARNWPYTRRNEAFYLMIRGKLGLLLAAHGFVEIRKRRFVKEGDLCVWFFEFNQTKNRNAVVISFGKVMWERSEHETMRRHLTGFHSLSSLSDSLQWIRPPHWKHGYEYPVRKSDRRDARMIQEMEQLIRKQLPSLA